MYFQATTDLFVGAYVTVASDYESHGDAADGPLAPGRAGLIIKQDASDIPFLVSIPTSGATLAGTFALLL